MAITTEILKSPRNDRLSPERGSNSPSNRSVSTHSCEKKVPLPSLCMTSPLQQLIPVMNRVQDILASVGELTCDKEVSRRTMDLDLPQIAVVGSQSVGKSSVLESLVGHDFLPRGTGIVTRCPLILQLRQVDAGEATWAQFGHTETTFADFSEVRQEIVRETERKGGDCTISADPILLKVFSPDVIDLTLIDLPGITKVPVGKQPPDIERQVRAMIMNFIEKPSCIILAVTAANTDLANSDSLKLAREVDPRGLRTLGVITKCDITGPGVDALDMLLGRVYPLQKGYVGVVCRNQKDINEKVTMAEAVEAENEFFRGHPSYRTIARRCGTRYLSVVLNQILMHHIKDTLPELKQRVQRALFETEQEFRSYGLDMSDKRDKGPLILEICARFSRNYQDAIDGRLAGLYKATSLAGGARLHYIFHDWFGKTLEEFDPLKSLTLMEIRTAIRNATGPKAKVFVPESAFELLLRSQIEKLRQPSLQCVEQVHEELQRIVDACEVEELERYPCLKKNVLSVVRHVLRTCLEPSNRMVENLIQMELAYCNTSHPDFLHVEEIFDHTAEERENKKIDTGAPTDYWNTHVTSRFVVPVISSSTPHVPAPAAAPTKTPDADTTATPNANQVSVGSLRLPHVPAVVTPASDMSEREAAEIELVQRLITSYFNIVRKNISDYVPKAIMSFMVNTSKEVIQRELTAQLYKEDAFDDLLSESPGIREERKACRARLEGLKTALQVINELRNVDLET